MTAAQLIAEFEIMLAEKWPYEWGAAKKGTVDCSGAFVYAMKKYGLSIYHGSNTIYRQYLTDKGKIGEIELVPGMAVFKWREEGEPDKYIADELDDFYHIGLYVGGDRVLEAKGTKYGFVESKLKGWQYAGRIKGINYSGTTNKKEDLKMGMATVSAPTGGTVKMRNTASRNDKLYWEVPVGGSVEIVHTLTEGWSYCNYNGQKGYIQSQYLVGMESVPDGSTAQPGDQMAAMAADVRAVLDKYGV